jgi:hypothetical protein
MPDTQTAWLQRLLLRRHEVIVDTPERALQGNDGPSAAVVNVLMTALLLAAVGSLLKAIVLMLVRI